MSSELAYSRQRLPDLIDSLKSQVKKNLAIVNRPVESDLSSDKYFNVLKGRRMAAELAINSMNAIDKIEKELEIDKEESYFKENLPVLIEHLKEMFDINLAVVDIDVDEEESEDLKEVVAEDLDKMFGKDVAKKILRKMNSYSLSEDKYANVIKAREKAVEDNQWVLQKIDELENTLRNKKKQDTRTKSWAVLAAEKDI